MLGCTAIKKENPGYSNYDIREIVMKGCISILQKATIREAFPDEYKDKKMQELARESHKNREGSGQTTEFDNTENRTFMHKAGAETKNESDEERDVLRREIDVLKNEVKVL
jgi:hypothetical protein